MRAPGLGQGAPCTGTQDSALRDPGREADLVREGCTSGPLPPSTEGWKGLCESQPRRGTRSSPGGCPDEGQASGSIGSLQQTAGLTGTPCSHPSWRGAALPIPESWPRVPCVHLAYRPQQSLGASGSLHPALASGRTAFEVVREGAQTPLCLPLPAGVTHMLTYAYTHNHTYLDMHVYSHAHITHTCSH